MSSAEVREYAKRKEHTDAENRTCNPAKEVSFISGITLVGGFRMASGHSVQGFRSSDMSRAEGFKRNRFRR